MEALRARLIVLIVLVAVMVTSPPTRDPSSHPGTDPVFYSGSLNAASAASATDAANGSYLHVWTNLAEAETFDRVRIEIRSELSSNGSMEPNLNPIRVILYAIDMDLTVQDDTIRLFFGSGTVTANVLPEWTTAEIQIIVRDDLTGLINDTASFRTRMSWEYFLYLDALDEYEDDQRDQRILQARIDLITNLGITISVSLGATLFVIFLRADHRRSRRVNAPSLWDRFIHRIWPYSWTMDEAYAMLEDPETWAPGIADQFRDFRKEAHLRKLRQQVEEIKREAKAVQEGRIHV